MIQVNHPFTPLAPNSNGPRRRISAALRPSRHHTPFQLDLRPDLCILDRSRPALTSTVSSTCLSTQILRYYEPHVGRSHGMLCYGTHAHPRTRTHVRTNDVLRSRSSRSRRRSGRGSVGPSIIHCSLVRVDKQTSAVWTVAQSARQAIHFQARVGAPASSTPYSLPALQYL